MDFCRQKNKLEKGKKKKEKDETKEEYLPWRGRYSARAGLKNGFLRVGEVHKLTKRKKNSALYVLDRLTKGMLTRQNPPPTAQSLPL